MCFVFSVYQNSRRGLDSLSVSLLAILERAITNETGSDLNVPTEGAQTPQTTDPEPARYRTIPNCLLARQLVMTVV